MTNTIKTKVMARLSKNDDMIHLTASCGIIKSFNNMDSLNSWVSEVNAKDTTLRPYEITSIDLG
jgi:transcriptional regulator NrdR family protein